MKKYIEPAYEVDCLETADIILASITIEDLGEATIGNITGKKGVATMDFNDLLAMR